MKRQPSAWELREEAERAERWTKKRKAIEKGIAAGPPFMKLTGRPGEAPMCPKCHHMNAMLEEFGLGTPHTLYVCRDCAYVCYDERDR